MNRESSFRLGRLPRRILILACLLVLVFVVTDLGQADWFPKCNQRSEYPGYCCWSGSAPICTAGCPNGYAEVRDSKDGDGALNYCVIGTHKLCCP